MKITKLKVFKWSIGKYILPKRLTLKCNPPIYQWLWFQIGLQK